MRLLVAAVLLVTGIAVGAEDPPESHVKAMKELGKQMGEMRKGVDVEKNAAAMQVTLKDVAAFWKPRGAEDAMKACGENMKGAKAVEAAAKAGDKEGIAAGMKMVGAGCKGCHDPHREKISDTVYKIK